MTQQPRHISLVNVYLRTQVEAAKDGNVTLAVTGPTKADLWIDGTPVKGEREFTTHVKAGKHTVLVRLDAKVLPSQVRLKSRELSFATE